MPKLREITRVLRSKNAGPFEITYDIMFKDENHFLKVSASNVFTIANIARTLKYSDNVVRIIYYPPAHAIKITVPRRHPSGSFEDTDVFGCQQHAPLLDLDVP